jgi:hypothetical protein
MRFSSEEPEESFYGYSRDKDNIETCKKKGQQNPGYLGYLGPHYTGDTLYYRESGSKKLLLVYPEMEIENLSSDLENKVFLHKSKLYFISSPSYRDTRISGIFAWNNFGERLLYSKNICKIISRSIPNSQP